MKILHFISKFAGGGLERRAIQTVKGLNGLPGVEQCIIVFSDKIEYNEVLSLDVDIHYLKHLGKIGEYRELRSILSQFKPDILHSWLDRFPTEHVLLPFLKYRFGYKYIHGAVCDGNKLPVFSKIWFTQKFSFTFADAIVSNSKAGLIAKGAPMGKSVVIYNGFDFGRLPQDIDLGKKKELGVKTPNMVVMCGRVDNSKDWTSYIEVAKKANDAGLKVTFLAVGNGAHIEKCRGIVKDNKLGNILFVGRRSDVEEIISLSDICILLSNTQKHAEGVSNFIMESMASGKPVIATRGGGTPEIINDGVNGFIVDNNVTETFDRLRDLLFNEELRMAYGAKAKEEIHHRFTLELMTQNYYSLYKTLLKQ